MWVVWGGIAFVALNIQASPVADFSTTTRPKPGLASLLAILREDIDTRRYFAYAQAMLGRAYDGFYVRPASEAVNTPAGQHQILTPSAPMAPWRDFAVEYPPGVLIAALPPALLTDDFRVYHFLFGLEMELLLTAAAILAVQTAKRFGEAQALETMRLCILMLIALGVIAARRYDALVSVCIAGAAYGLAAKRSGFAGASLAAAIVAKGAPVLLAPIGIIALCRGDFIRAILSGAVLLLVTGLAYSWLAGPHTFDALAYHADRPIQIESPYGATLVIVDYFRPDLLSFVYSYGSWNIAASFEPPLRILSFALTLVALIGVYVVYARGMARLGTLQSDSDDVGVAFTFSAMIAALIAFITLGKVFSPQYLTWLFPIGAITAASASKRSRALLFAGLAVAQVEYPYFPLLTGALVQPLFGAVALLRATLLIAAAASLMADFYPRKINLAPLRRERGLVAQNE